MLAVWKWYINEIRDLHQTFGAAGPVGLGTFFFIPGIGHVAFGGYVPYLLLSAQLVAR
jgi:hypothetical protein